MTKYTYEKENGKTSFMFHRDSESFKKRGTSSVAQDFYGRPEILIIVAHLIGSTPFP
jgi:hypothetical protein